MTQPRPVRVHVDDLPWRPAADAPTKVRIKRLITRGRHGSELTLGIARLDPGEATNRWSSMPENDAGPGEHWYGPVEETYYCLEGTLTLTWDEGEIVFGPGDAVYLAPGWHYHLANRATEPAVIVYGMYPSQE